MTPDSRFNDDEKDWGAVGERMAADYLRSNGYIVREQNWRVGKTIEIDIIAEKEKHIIFVEVKARNGNWEHPLEAITPDKIRKMVRGADIYLRGLDHMYEYQFDIITLIGTPQQYELEHYSDAFLAPVNVR